MTKTTIAELEERVEALEQHTGILAANVPPPQVVPVPPVVSELYKPEPQIPGEDIADETPEGAES